MCQSHYIISLRKDDFKHKQFVSIYSRKDLIIHAPFLLYLERKKIPYCVQKYLTHPKVFKLVGLNNIDMTSADLEYPPQNIMELHTTPTDKLSALPSALLH